MQNKTNEQIQAEIERKIAEMSPEEKAAMQEMESAMDRYMIAALQRKYGATVELIPNDHHHIKINGVLMGYNEFAGWLLDQQIEHGELDDPEDEEENEEGDGEDA